MAIKKKFNMFSTREWILYLQYKLSPEREKELNLRAEEDDFLKEAIEIIGEKENRPLAYQSLSQLISVIQENTGVSESKILKVKTGKLESDANSAPIFNLKLMLMSILGLILVGLLGYGIYYFSSSYDFTSDDIEEPMIEAETVSETQLYADSSTMPMETLPSAQTATSSSESGNISNENTSSNSTSNERAQIRNTDSRVEASIQNGSAAEPDVEVIKPNSESPRPNNTLSNSKERELFNKAQDLYKGGDRDGAKKILRDLKSYENPMQSKAENILKNMEN